MTDISELVGGSAHAAPRPGNCRGRVVKAPATTADPLTVTLENYSSLYEYEVPALHWQPHGDTLPTVGAVCLVSFDDDGDAWVPAWQGAQTSATRTIRGGVVGSTGAVAYGTGFTSSRAPTGLYTVTFTIAFSAPPAVTVTAVDWVTAFTGALPTASGFQANTFISNTGAGVDRSFSFIAEGPA